MGNMGAAVVLESYQPSRHDIMLDTSKVDIFSKRGKSHSKYMTWCASDGRGVVGKQGCQRAHQWTFLGTNLQNRLFFNGSQSIFFCDRGD